MYKWTYEQSVQKQQNAEIEKMKIFDMPDTPLYHYTSREVFWKIMESETFLARHIMFSNDFEENKIGKDMIRSAMNELHLTPEASEALPFMICFCEKDDLLSQWRGYAKEGVALEFDFSKGMYGLEEGFSSYYCYTIMNRENGDEFACRRPLEDADKGLAVGAVVSPYAVIYTDNSDENRKVIQDKIQLIKEQTDVATLQQRAISMIPYIKNNKFNEEKEYRLIFDMNLLVPKSRQYLLEEKYTYLEINGVRKPNIRIKFGNLINREGNSAKVIYADASLDALMKSLKKELKKDGIKLECICKPRKYRLGKKEILISDCQVQEKICTRLRLSLQRSALPRTDVKVWCDGHLPVRRIVVGPSPDAELMKCSIEEYIKTKYWMKDIQVEISRIPLRV